VIPRSPAWLPEDHGSCWNVSGLVSIPSRERPVCGVLRGLAYRDDSQVGLLHPYYVLDPRHPRLEVMIARAAAKAPLYVR
jgi:hypothetical protein